MTGIREGARRAYPIESLPPSGEKVTQMDTDLLSDTFIELARDTMVADFDILDFLHMLTDRGRPAAGRVRRRCRAG